MKQIKELVMNIRGEMEGAEHYAKLAVQYKDEDRQLADMYSKLAGIELEHITTLHEQAVRIIKAYKAEGGETPAAMQAVWNWEHDLMTETVSRIKLLLSQYKS